MQLKSDLKFHFAERLMHLTRLCGHSQEQLAQILGIKRETLNAVVNGRKESRQISKAFDMLYKLIYLENYTVDKKTWTLLPPWPLADRENSRVGETASELTNEPEKLSAHKDKSPNSGPVKTAFRQAVRGDIRKRIDPSKEP
jgi:DNA-binding XRE family transcriptional regulator